MTPLERMAYAHCRARSTPGSDEVLGPCEPDGDCACVELMRAALLALAEAELPTNIIGTGASRIAGVRTEHGDGRHLWEARAAFQAMCRAIGEGET